MSFTIPDTFNHDPPDVSDTSQTWARLNSIFTRTERLGRHRLKQARQLRVPVTPKITKIAQNSDFLAKTPNPQFPANFPRTGAGNTFAWDVRDELKEIGDASGANTALTCDGLDWRVEMVEKNASSAVISREGAGGGNRTLVSIHPSLEFRKLLIINV